MKKLLIAASILLFSTQALAVSAEDTRFQIRNVTNTGNLFIDVPRPVSGNVLFGWDSSSTFGRLDGGTGSPYAVTIGTGLTYTGSVPFTLAVTAPLAEYEATTIGNGEMVWRDGSGVLDGMSLSGLKTALNLTKSDVGLGNVDNTADSAKIFAASQVTSGTFADARIAQSNVTQHQAALSVASSQVTGTKTSSYISDFTTAARGAFSAGTGISITSGIIASTAPALSINNSPGRSLVSATNATGFQISSTRIADVCYEGTFQTTSTIGGPSAITVFLETADTNSTTPGDWTTIAKQTNSNTITLAVVLQQVDIEPWSLCRKVAAAKYVRIRYGSVTGAATATINTEQQETQL